MLNSPTPPSRRFCDRIRPLALLVGLAALVALSGCPLEFQDLEEPTILDVTVAPSQISQDEIGPHNQFDSIEISTANFDDELDPDTAEVFISDNPARSVDRHGPGDVEVEVRENVVIFQGVDYSWFAENDEPGDYEIGASVEAANTATQASATANLEIVTVTQ